ncbi:zinc finger protein 615-like [Toxorhynchites rutilus septentrionalis]|uniref:zinc finger protein 615-like n=1 Tax=Toxorhynchites rutilus septentrionalis TaxID=329112 RepID=UPI0024790808|nr:zinc finger protein 615-like [Toxorhynchites rutilus septentrionalis]
MQKKSRRDCFIPGCTSQIGQVTFMSAYSSENLQRWWSASIWVQNRKIKTIAKDMRVCEKHFEEKYIDRTYKLPRLLPDAWPTKNIEQPKPEKMYCRLCGKSGRWPMENHLDHFKNEEEFLRLCLGKYFSRLDLPQGFCNACKESIGSCMAFLRKCELTQHKLDALFRRSEEFKTEPECKSLVVEELKRKEQELEEPKQEKQEQDEQDKSEPAQHLIIEEILEESVVTDIKVEPYMFSGIEHNSDDDYIVAADDPAEDMIVDSKSPKYSKEQCESDNESDSDYTPTPKKSPHKKSRKAGKSIKGLEETNTLNVVDEFSGSPEGTKLAAAKPKVKKAQSGPVESSRVCPNCGKTFVRLTNFTAHLKLHSDKKDFVCNICGKGFHVRRELRMHIESLHEKKTFVCNVCGIECAWQKGLQRHMRMKHGDGSSYKHKCTFCDKAFLAPNQLRRHVMKHTGDRITCDICGAGYRFNYMLTQHKIREHGMVFKGVKLYKNSNRSRKKDVSKGVSAAAASTEEPDNLASLLLEFNQESNLSSES